MRVTTTSIQGLGATVAKEAIVLMPYFDSVGVLTVFIGHTANAGAPDPRKYPMGIEQPLEEAFKVFVNDSKKFERRVAKHLVTNRQNEFDAGFSFDFNTGAVDRATWVKTHNAGDRALAAKQIMNWSKPPEIIARRQGEQRMYRDAAYPQMVASVIPADAKGKVLWGKARRINVLPIMRELFEAKEESKKEDNAKAGTAVSGSGTAVTGGAEVTQPQPELPATLPPEVTQVLTDWIPTLVTAGLLVFAVATVGFALWWLAKNRNVRKQISKALSEAIAAKPLEETQHESDSIGAIHSTGFAIDSRDDR